MNRPATELSDSERKQLQQALRTNSIQAEQLGYMLADSDTATDQCIVAAAPETGSGTVSVCGAKTILIEELRKFETADGEGKEIRCVTAAILEMTDSPIHVHESTLEHYIILSGAGKFILGSGDNERVVEVQNGSVALLQPGQPHGIVSDNPNVPIRALLTFSPGLAPKEEPEFRDEEVIHARASERLREIRVTSG